MDAGLVQWYDQWKMSISVSGSATRDSTLVGCRIAGGAATYYTLLNSSPLLSPGISISAQSVLAGGGSPFGATGTVYTLSIPDLISDQQYTTGSFTTSLSTYVEIDNLGIYQQGGVWVVRWTELRWYAGGGLRFTLSGDVEQASLILTPSSIPFFGIPPELTAGAGIDQAPLVPWGYVPYNCTVDATVTGGWQGKLKGDSGWTAYPVAVSIPTAASAGGGCSFPSVTLPSATDTSDGQVYAETHCTYAATPGLTFECRCCPDGQTIPPEFPAARFTYTRHEATYRTRNCSLTMLPCVPKSIWKLNPDDYAAMVYRGGFPQVQKEATSGCAIYNDPTNPFPSGGNDVTETTEVNPSLTEFLATVENATHVIETPFGWTTYAPGGYNAYLQEVDLKEITDEEPGACPATPPGGYTGDPCEPCVFPQSTAKISSRTGIFPIVNYAGDELGFLEVQTPSPNYHIPRYINYTANPHWSFFLWFPPDSMTTLWKVDDAKVGSGDYWSPIRQQWLEHPDLPNDERLKTRNHIVTEPLMIAPELAAFCEAIFGEGSKTSWWGVHRIFSENVIAAGTYTMEQGTPGWTGINCSVMQTATEIECLPTNGTDTTLYFEWEIGSFTNTPYLVPHMVRYWGFPIVTANLVSFACHVVGAYGNRALLANTGAPTQFAVYDDPNYAGDWQDFGLGVVTDEGLDILPNGRSAPTLADPERNFAFQLLAGRTAKKLRFTVVITDPEIPFKMGYPVWNPDETGRVIQLTGQTAVSLRQFSAGIRYGQWNWWDDDEAELRTEPVIRPMGEKQTALDWLIFRHLVYDMKPATEDLDDEIQAWFFDEYEGNTQEAVAHDTIGLYLDAALEGQTCMGRGVCYNARAQVPPLAQFPLRKRDATTFEPDGDWGQEAYTYIQNTQYVVSAQHETHLEKPATYGDINSARTRWTALDANQVDGWKITKHTHEVDNNEQARFYLHWDGATEGKRDCATVSPYHGYFLVWTEGEPVAKGIWHLLDYTKYRLDVLPNADDELECRVYDFDDVSYDPYIIDDNACSRPVFHLNLPFVTGTYLRDDALRVALNRAHGRDTTNDGGWETSELATGVENVISCVQKRNLLIGAFAGGDWYLYVGYQQADGSFNFSSALALGLTAPSLYATLLGRQDKVVELLWTNVSGALNVTRLRGVGTTSAGAMTAVSETVSSVGSGYEGVTAANWKNALCVALWSPDDGAWVMRVGQADGTGYSWSDGAALPLDAPTGNGCLLVRSDGVLEFVYIDTNGAVRMYRGRGVGESAGALTGTWEEVV